MVARPPPISVDLLRTEIVQTRDTLESLARKACRAHQDNASRDIRLAARLVGCTLHGIKATPEET